MTICCIRRYFFVNCDRNLAESMRLAPDEHAFAAWHVGYSCRFVAALQHLLVQTSTGRPKLVIHSFVLHGIMLILHVWVLCCWLMCQQCMPNYLYTYEGFSLLCQATYL